MISQLKKYLTHPLARGLDIDSPEVSRAHRRIIQEKPFLKALYTEWYADIMNSLPKDIGGPVVEIGSGGGFLKDIIPDVITSEVSASTDVDIVFDGHYLPFKENSLKGIVMVDVFHHLHRVGVFLRSAARCVKPGGVIVMIEPWNTRWSRLVYKYLHHEHFDDETQHWDFPEGGPLSRSNQALPWIVFERDRRRFESDFEELKIHAIKKNMPFSYLISGGLSFRSVMHGDLFNACRKFEGILNPWIDFWAMFALISLVKNENDRGGR